MIRALPSKIYTQFPALQYRNYRLYFFGQVVSITGSWLHGVAHGWLVYELTASPFWLGAVSAISGLPVLILSLYGGFLVDRFSRKKLLVITQSSSLVLAFTLGLLTLTGLINLPLLLLLTLLSGVANAIDNPATQAFVVDVVGKDDLPSAVGLNSTIFNTGRVLGPSAAGFLIGMAGVSGIFMINAASFLAILISLYFIKINNQVRSVRKENPFRAIRDGIKYSYAHPVISMLLLTAAIGAIFCFSQATIMPVIAERVFQQGAGGLGKLLSATGLGALIGSLIVSSQSKRIRPFYLIASGNIVFILSMITFSFTTNMYHALICLFFSGLGSTLQFSSIYASIQRMVKEDYRGRVSSIYVLFFVGLSPIGNLFIGSATSWMGPQVAIRLFIAIIALYGVIMVLSLPRVKRKYYSYIEAVEEVNYLEASDRF